MGSFSIGHWVIVLIIILLLFGTRKLGNVGSDLGKAVKGFKDNVKSGENNSVALEKRDDNGQAESTSPRANH